MHKMEELKEMLCRELDEYAKKGELSAGSLDIIDKLTHSIKSIDTIIAMEGYSGDEYSNNGSYARRRDSMGRYARRGSYDYARDYARDYSNAEAKDELKEELKGLMQDAKDDETRRMISEWIRQVR